MRERLSKYCYAEYCYFCNNDCSSKKRGEIKIVNSKEKNQKRTQENLNLFYISALISCVSFILYVLFQITLNIYSIILLVFVVFLILYRHISQN